MAWKHVACCGTPALALTAAARSLAVAIEKASGSGGAPRSQKATETGELDHSR